MSIKKFLGSTSNTDKPLETNLEAAKMLSKSKIGRKWRRLKQTLLGGPKLTKQEAKDILNKAFEQMEENDIGDDLNVYTEKEILEKIRNGEKGIQDIYKLAKAISRIDPENLGNIKDSAQKFVNSYKQAKSDFIEESLYQVGLTEKPSRRRKAKPPLPSRKQTPIPSRGDKGKSKELNPLEKSGEVDPWKGAKPDHSSKPSKKMLREREYHQKKDAQPWILNMLEAGKRLDVMIFDEFVKTVEKSTNLTDKQKKALCGLAERQLVQSTEQLAALHDLFTSDPIFKEGADEVILPSDKESVEKFKELSGHVLKAVCKHIEETAKGYCKDVEKSIGGFSPESVDELRDLSPEAKKKIEKISVRDLKKLRSISPEALGELEKLSSEDWKELKRVSPEDWKELEEITFDDLGEPSPEVLREIEDITFDDLGEPSPEVLREIEDITFDDLEDITFNALEELEKRFPEDWKKLMDVSPDALGELEEISSNTFEELKNISLDALDVLMELSLKDIDQLEKLSPDALEELKDLPEDFQKNAKDLVGKEIFAVIHDLPEWDPDKGVSRIMLFNKDNSIKSASVTSTFRAMGPAYSSQAPRNRTEENAYVPNYWETGVKIDDHGIEDHGSKRPAQYLSATRSAVTNEFSQQNVEERKKVNRKLVRQVLEGHARRKLSKMSWDELKNANDLGTPITVKSQTVNLLTPDMLRTLATENRAFRSVASRLHHGMSGSPSDNERTLAHENLEAYQSQKNETMELEVENENGEKLTIEIKFDIRYFNIPNNVMFENVPKLLSRSEALQEENHNSWKLLDTDTSEELKKLDTALNKVLKEVDNEEHEWLEKAMIELNAKNNQRDRVSYKTRSRNPLASPDQDFEKWQGQADDLSEKIQKYRQKGKHSEKMKEALNLLEHKSKLDDLYRDTKELYESGLSVNLEKMDNNRSALATRMIALGMLLNDVDVHFGCRSGKDRTGLVDIEIKLLFTMATLNGRIPSYREQEKMKQVTQWRDIMTLESGNFGALVKTSVGSSIGGNTFGSASNPPSKAQEKQKAQQQETTQAAQAWAKAVFRPKTKFQVPAGNQEYFKNRPVMISSLP